MSLMVSVTSSVFLDQGHFFFGGVGVELVNFVSNDWPETLLYPNVIYVSHKSFLFCYYFCKVTIFICGYVLSYYLSRVTLEEVVNNLTPWELTMDGVAVNQIMLVAAVVVVVQWKKTNGIKKATKRKM